MKPIILLVFSLAVVMAQPAKKSCDSEIIEWFIEELCHQRNGPICCQCSNEVKTSMAAPPATAPPTTTAAPPTTAKSVKECPTFPATNPGEPPKKFEKLGDKCYYFINEFKYWNDALSDCNRLGLTLALPRNEQENQLLYQYLTSKVDAAFAAAWLGANDGANEGSWVDANNTKIAHENWASGQPLGGQYNNCLVMQLSSNGTWAAYDCKLIYQFACEL